MRKAVVVSLLVLALVVSVAAEIAACYVCVKSPNGWGFCKPGATKGYGSCSEIVVDSFSGRTDCDRGPVCYNGGTTADGGEYDDLGEPLTYADNSPCSWTDIEIIRLV